MCSTTESPIKYEKSAEGLWGHADDKRSSAGWNSSPKLPQPNPTSSSNPLSWSLRRRLLPRMKQISNVATQYPVPSTQYPVPSTQYPVPSTQYPVPSTQYPVPSTQYPVPSTQYPVPSTQYPVPSTQYTVHSAQYTVPSTQYTVRMGKIRGVWPVRSYPAISGPIRAYSDLSGPIRGVKIRWPSLTNVLLVPFLFTDEVQDGRL